MLSGEFRWSRRVAWTAACALTWAVCCPFYGPTLALMALVVPGLVFSPVLANCGVVLRNRGFSSLELDWSWRRLAAPQAWLPAVQLAVVTALGSHFVRHLGPVFLWTCAVLDALLALSWLAAAGVRVVGRSEDTGRRRASTPERLMVLSALAGAVGMGVAAWAVRLVVLPITYGAVTPGPPWRSATWVYAWLDEQIGGSLFGPSFEQPYWPLLPAGAGLVSGLLAAATRQAADRAGRARNPFAQAENGAGGKVFLSYSRSDTEFARALTEALRGWVREVWVDWQAIKPSARWRKSISDGIRESDALIVLISRKSLASVYCWDECLQAIEGGKRILPVVIDPELSSGAGAALREAGWEELTAFQRLDMSDPDRFEEDTRHIVAFTAQEHRWVSGHTRLGLQAHEWRESGRSDGFLLREDELRAAEWLRDNVPASPAFMARLTDDEQEFIDSSRRALRRRRVRFRISAVAVLLAIVSLSSLVVAVQSGAEADRRASLSRLLAVASRSQSGGRLDTSSLLAAAAYGVSDTAEARSAMAERLMQFNHVAKVLPGPDTKGAGWPVFSADGSTLAVGRTDGTTQIWDVEGWRLRGTFRGRLPQEGRRGLTSDGRVVALLTGTRVTVNDTATRRTVASFGLAEDGPPFGWSGGLSPDGRILVASTSYQRAWTWSVPSRRLLARHDSECAFSSLSPSGRWLWCQSGEQGRLHDVLTSSSASDVPVGLSGAWQLLGWTASDEPVIDTGDGPPKVLPAGGKGTPWVPERGMSISSVSADGRRALLSDAHGHRFAVWDLRARKKLGDVEPADLDGVSGTDSDEQVAALTGIAPTHGMWLSTGGARGTGVWDLSAPAPPHPYVVFSPDGRAAVSVTETGVVAWNRTAAGRLVSEIPLKGGDSAARPWSTVSPDGNTVASVSGRTVHLFDTRTGRLRQTIRLKGSGNGITYSRDGTRLAVSETVSLPPARSGERTLTTIVEVFALPAGKRVALIESVGPNGSPQETTGLSLSPDGRLVYLAVSQDHTIHVWDTIAGHMVKSYHLGEVEAVALSPDGHWLAAVDRQGVLHQWNTATGRSVLSYRGAARTVAFSQDGRTLVAASESLRSLLVFDAETQRKRAADVDTGATIRAVRLSDAQGVAVITLDAESDGGAVIVWDLLHHARIGPVLARVGGGAVAELTADGKRAVGLAPGAIVTGVVDPRTWQSTLCSVVGRPLLGQEWHAVVPDQRYTPAC
ncbi:TIR domain-containing protein [Streptomyces sp. ISL-22]|uniref:toll/interleukin-1 receptor domain-containing protein n=1 Tax=unclassified Streptomyces TaxID=2593676 RepID=UPI001BEA522F|nr:MULTISPECIES: TIR domain-containing protein [unclassified Streptomyces]MBT2417780.1 TIR domain-containing protein [Streptomyces sp. ISL-24]MBT2438058.1 TIR domain-containing protein [Streptomyces sp. ISL-22]